MPKRIKQDAVTGFGPRDAALRKQAGITHSALAQEVGVSQRMMA
jgi:DNA-binding XRE family transcriptional regulator